MSDGWMARAACNDDDHRPTFHRVVTQDEVILGRVGSARADLIAKPARAAAVAYCRSVCAECRVGVQCAAYADDNPAQPGVLAGTTIEERLWPTDSSSSPASSGDRPTSA